MQEEFVAEKGLAKRLDFDITADPGWGDEKPDNRSVQVQCCLEAFDLNDDVADRRVRPEDLCTDASSDSGPDEQMFSHDKGQEYNVECTIADIVVCSQPSKNVACLSKPLVPPSVPMHASTRMRASWPSPSEAPSPPRCARLPFQACGGEHSALASRRVSPRRSPYRSPPASSRHRLPRPPRVTAGYLAPKSCGASPGEAAQVASPARSMESEPEVCGQVRL